MPVKKKTSPPQGLVSLLQGRPYVNFINSIRSDKTKHAYRKALLRFLAYSKLSLEEMLTLPVLDIENMVTDYLTDLKNRDLSSGFVGQNFSALKHFYSMNDVRINTHKIGKFLGEQKKKNTDRAYKHEEVKALLDVCDLRLKVVVLVLASTGMRIGAIAPLQLKHLEKKDNGVYKFVVYENTKDEYTCFCSPECSTYIDSYLQYRTRSGENLTKDSYLIREQFDVNDIEQIRKRGRGVSTNTVVSILYFLLIKSGLRQVNHNFTKKEREPVPLAHGFRKFWMNQAVNSKLNPEIREMLLGHSIGLASAYYRPSEEEILEEYMKGVDSLTINEENRLKRKVEKLEVEKSYVDQLRIEIDQIKKAINR